MLLMRGNVWMLQGQHGNGLFSIQMYPVLRIRLRLALENTGMESIRTSGIGQRLSCIVRQGKRNIIKLFCS
ncbi:hypothetical protein D3C76_1742460 [compost metagenome]